MDLQQTHFDKPFGPLGLCGVQHANPEYTRNEESRQRGGVLTVELSLGIDPDMLKPPVNVLRLSLHPRGLSTKIVNLAQWRTHLLERLRQQVAATADPVLADLLEELRGYPMPDGAQDTHLEGEHLGVVMPFQFRTDHGVLSFISTTTIFGTPVDVTLQELMLETFFPADTFTGDILRKMLSPT